MFLTDLMRHISTPCQVDMMAVQSYAADKRWCGRAPHENWSDHDGEVVNEVVSKQECIQVSAGLYGQPFCAIFCFELAESVARSNFFWKMISMFLCVSFAENAGCFLLVVMIKTRTDFFAR